MSAVFSGPFGSDRISFLSCYIFSSISSRRSRMRREGTDQFEQSLGYYQGIRRPGLENPWFRQQAEVAYCWIWRSHLQFPIISNRTHEYGMKRPFLLVQAVVAAMPVHSWDKHCRKLLDSVHKRIWFTTFKAVRFVVPPWWPIYATVDWCSLGGVLYCRDNLTALNFMMLIGSLVSWIVKNWNNPP